VPEIVAGLDLGNVINGDLKPVAITIVRPKTRWIKTVGGAVKFDIGAKKPGDSGKIFEDFLITLASAPDPDARENKILPGIRIVDADILIGNELANTEMHISDADILIAPHADGVRSVFDLAVETATAPVNISAVGLYRTEDQQIELELNFDDLTLDDFGAMLPEMIPYILLPEFLSGTVELDMDKFFSTKAVVFDISGEDLDLSGEAHMGARLVSMKIEGSLSEDSLVALSNARPSGLGGAFDSWLSKDAATRYPVVLALEGSVHRFDQTLDFSGTIGSSATPLSVSGISGNSVIDIPAAL